MQEILAKCVEHGFQVREARTENDVLELVPRSLDHLPSSDVLRALALDLKASFGVRWVALVVEETE